MNQKPSNAALAILLGGASFVAPVFAQDTGKPVPGANLQYVGADTRLGIGIDSDRHARGELFQVFRSDSSSATLGEVWASRNSGGAKLSQHWVNGNSAVNKAFAAFDQGDKDLRKATLGGGQEYENWFWNTYLSKGLSGARLGAVTSVATRITQTGVDAGRPYEEDLTTTVTSKSFSRPYDWGVGARAGHFYEASLVRVTAGLDYEWGKFSSRQWTGTLTAEKFFAGSPVSLAITGELFRRSGDFEGRRTGQHGLVMIRYEFGAPQSSFKSNKLTRMVTSTERVPDPNWSAPAPANANAPAAVAAGAAAPAKAAEPTTRIEKRTVSSSSRDAQETYFDLGSAILKPAAKKELDGLVSRIAEQRPYVNLKVNVVGHTCPTGSDRNNSMLSIKRAEAVKAYLVSKGVPIDLVTTSGEAGRSPKYPEVKGQSFRNRRADTGVLIVKEKTEDVTVTVPGAAAPLAAQPPTSVAAVAAPASAPMIERPVQREVVDTVTNNWMARALHNTAQHKASVDTYRWAQSSAASVTGARRYINRPPVAANDAYTIECNAPATFNVLVNDSDIDNDSLSITSVTTPGKGTAFISGGRVVYTPAASSCVGAVDTFSYTIADGKGGTATANVAVTINAAPPANKPPVAVNDAYTVECNAPSTFSVLTNDSDPDNDTLTIASVTTPGKGSASISAGRVVYTPAAGTCGGATDTFNYTISDGKGGTASASVAVTIKAAPVIIVPPVNNVPVAVNDAYTVECNTPSTFNVLLNDSDADNDALTITNVTSPGKGTASISAGRVVYTPAASTCGGTTDSFSYTIADGKGGTASASVAVTIKAAPVIIVPPVNNLPVAVNDAYTVECNAPSTFNVLLNDSDADNDALTITNVTVPGRGTASISSGRVLYTPAANTCGGATDSFSYSISDGKGGSATAVVAVTVKAAVVVVNTPPLAVNDVYTVPCTSGAVLNVLANDSDKDGDPLTITSITQPAWSSIAISADGKSLNYMPTGRCFIYDSFTYTISDGRGGASTASVTLIDP